ncbi:hypothetical protein ACVMHZ_002006 [Bradyrhizobium liaoningense]
MSMSVFGHELVDLDRVGGVERDLVQLVLGDLDIGVGVDLVALDDVLGGHLVAGLGVDLEVFDPVAGLAVDLVERDFFGIRGGRIERDRAGHERQTQKTLPIGAGGHGLLQTQQRTNAKDNIAQVRIIATAGAESCNGVNRGLRRIAGRGPRSGTSPDITRCPGHFITARKSRSLQATATD